MLYRVCIDLKGNPVGVGVESRLYIHGMMSNFGPFLNFQKYILR